VAFFSEDVFNNGHILTPKLLVPMQRYGNKLIQHCLDKGNLFLPCSRLIPQATVEEGKLFSKIEVFFSVIKSNELC